MNLRWALLASTLIATPAFAQAPDTSSIVVTARKNEERLLQTPVSIRYYSGEDLENRNTLRVSDIPGFGSRETPTNSTAMVIAVRGQTQTDVAANVDPSVGVYVDGIYAARSYGINTALLDVKNVQILGGPQGTFFGRNTTGGAILIETNDPKINDLTGNFSATYGRLNEYRLEGVANLPVSDTVAVRLAGNRIERDGFVRNVRTNQLVDNMDSYQLRGKILFEPSYSFRTVITGEYSNSNASGDTRRVVYGFGPVSALATPNAIDETRSDLVNTNSTEVAAVTMKNEIGPVTLLSGWRSVKSSQLSDLDGSMSPMFVSMYDVDVDQYSTEIQYNGGIGENFYYTLGAIYLNEKGSDNAPAIINGNRTQYKADFNHKSYGGYGHGSYTLGDVTLNAGIRFTRDEKDQTTYNGIYSTPGNLVYCFSTNAQVNRGCAVNLSASNSKVSWSAGIDYQLNDLTLVYGKVATGYKSGGNQLRAALPIHQGAFKPENTIEYEVGVKGDVGMFAYQLAGYYNRTTDGQYNTIYTVPTTYTVMSNAAKTRNIGFEADITAQITYDLRVRAWGLINDPKFLEYKDVATGADLTANRFVAIVKKQFMVDAEYTRGRYTFNVNYVWTDKIASASNPLSVLTARYGATEANKIYNATFVPTNGNLNLRATANFGNMDVTLWGRNVLNTRYNSHPAMIEGAFISSSWNDPATYGITARVKF